MEQRKKQIRRSGGRFYGFRINCEQVPVLPAWAVHSVWDDPRQISYLLVWNSHRDGEVKDAVRVARFIAKSSSPEADSVEVKRTDGSQVRIYLAWRWQPHGGISLLLRCWRCQKPRRALYGAKVGDDGRFYVARRADWECRTCCTLRYSSEGGALLIRGGLVSRLLGQPFPDVSSPRPELWLPNIFSSPREAEADGLCIVRNG
jgi:hypothetical protein